MNWTDYKTSKYNFLVPTEKGHVLFNALYTSLIELDEVKAKIISAWADGMFFNEDTPVLSKDDLQFLVENYFLVEKEKDELALIQKRHEAYKQNITDQGSIDMLINTTNGCNMNCAYCFESENKIGNSLSQESMDALVEKIEQEIRNPRMPIKTISTTWFGGEPLLNQKVIIKLSERLIKIAEENHLDYGSSIVTNGALLSPEIWELFKKYKISSMQVSIDGTGETHNSRRPLKNKADSYQTILNNLKDLPSNIKLTVRIHADKAVVEALPSLLTDLEEKGIWPQKARQINLHLAQKKYMDFSSEDKNLYLDQKEYTWAKYNFRILCKEHYNKWAAKNNLPEAKLRHTIPAPQYPICRFASQPYSIALDDLGFVHKCWENVNDPDTRIGHIKDFDFSDQEYQTWVNFDKLSYTQCKECKYLPLCDSTCVVDRLKNREYCAEWKFMLPFHIENHYNHLNSEAGSAL